MQGTKILFLGEAGVVAGVACATIISRVQNGAPTSDTLLGPGTAAVLAIAIAAISLRGRWSLADSRAFEGVWFLALWLVSGYASGGSSSAPIAWMGNLWWGIGLTTSVFDGAYGGRRAALAGSVAALGCGLYGAWSGSSLGLVGLATYGALVLTSVTVIGVSIAYLRTPSATRPPQPFRSWWRMYALIVLVTLVFLVGGFVYVFWR